MDAVGADAQVIEWSRRYGVAPISHALKRRSMVIYLALAVIGLLPTILGSSPGLRAAGLGLLLPGGGFFAVGGWAHLLIPLTLLALAAALIAWLMMANVVAPCLVWLGSAVLAGAMAHDHVVRSAPFTVIGLVLLLLVFSWRQSRRTASAEAERAAARAAYLPRAEAEVLARAERPYEAGTRELNRDDLAALRFAFDRALQPVEELNGFDIIEQYQTSALRYQFNYLHYALQIVQCHYTPNFHGYLSLAQRNLIEKWTLPRVWKFWRWESLFGNFSFDTNPIARDNVMFGGFLSANLNAYSATTGDRRYLEPGSLTFRLNDRKVFKHDLRTIADAATRNLGNSRYIMYPCEPTLAYGICNLQGMVGYRIADRVLGTNNGARITPALRQVFEHEYMTRDFGITAGRVTRLGIKIPAYTSNFTMAGCVYFGNAVFPDIARRFWAILREEAIAFDTNGQIAISGRTIDLIDIGNFKKSAATLLTYFLVAAREQGDREVAEAILRQLDTDFTRSDEGGQIAYKGMSVYANAMSILGRVMRTGDFANMILQGPPAAALAGPLLVDAIYPEVLVAKAFSNGRDLQLVLYPGGAGSRQRIGIERLAPGEDYSLHVGSTMSSFVADETGCARIEIDLFDRMAITITPAQTLDDARADRPGMADRR